MPCWTDWVNRNRDWGSYRFDNFGFEFKLFDRVHPFGDSVLVKFRLLGLAFQRLKWNNTTGQSSLHKDGISGFVLQLAERTNPYPDSISNKVGIVGYAF